MSRLTFTLRGVPDQRLDLSELVPAKLAGKSEKQIARIAVSTTRERLTAGDVFRIAMGDKAHIVFRRTHERLDRIGAGLAAGSITVSGDAGAYAGAAMTGGMLKIAGSTQPFAGAAMAGGVLEIGGDAGDFCGAALRGHMLGMTGGMIVVRGSAGERLGDRMRRGLIFVEGNCGALAGSRMIAGSIVVLGSLGPRAGMLMKRGTIVAAGAKDMLPTFNDCGTMPLGFTALYAGAFDAAGLKRPRKAVAPVMRRFAGDMASLGKGEILLAK